MLSGIYALYWESQDLIYIGLSQHLIRRKKEHFKDILDGKHSNYKVQKAYVDYGLPEFIVLEYCPVSQLNELEIYWQKEFNSLTSLDIIEAGGVARGYCSNASKYTRYELLKIFRDLSYNNSLSDISKKYNIPRYLPRDLASGTVHLWFHTEFPYIWNRIKKINVFRSNKIFTAHKKVVVLVSPTGEEITVEGSMQEFASRFGLMANRVADIVRGDRKSHRGWKLKNMVVVT